MSVFVAVAEAIEKARDTYIASGGETITLDQAPEKLVAQHLRGVIKRALAAGQD